MIVNNIQNLFLAEWVLMRFGLHQIVHISLILLQLPLICKHLCDSKSYPRRCVNKDCLNTSKISMKLYNKFSWYRIILKNKVFSWLLINELSSIPILLGHNGLISFIRWNHRKRSVHWSSYCHDYLIFIESNYMFIAHISGTTTHLISLILLTRNVMAHM